MIFSLLLSMFAPLVLGFVLISLLWPGQRPGRYFIIKGSVAAGLGFGLFSIILFIWLLVFGSSKNFIIFERALSVPLIISLFYAFKKQQYLLPAKVQDKLFAETGITRKLLIVFFLMLGFSLLAFILISLRHPHGGRDAWIVWNMRARFIFRSGEYWQNAFSNLLDWSQPDYPLLVPLSIVHGWVNIGRETLAVPVILAMLFTFSTVLLLLSSLTTLRSGIQGLLAGLILLGTPSFIRDGATQFADVPLGFFFLLTIVLLAFYDRTLPENHALLFLAGLSAGFAAWTKNEGFLFLISIVGARSLVIIQMRGWRAFLRQTAMFAVGLAPVLLVVMYFKTYMAPPNDILSAQGLTATLSKLTDPARYSLILREYIISGIAFTRCGLPLLAICLFLLGINKEDSDRAIVNTALIALALMFAGYFLVYVTTPKDLTWQLKTSLPRLFLQLWPSFIFFFFMLVNTPNRFYQKNMERLPKSDNKDYILATAIALAAVLVYLPSLQNGFVTWDDNIYIYDNPYIRAFDFNLFKWAFFGFHAGFWLPLTWLSYAIDHAVWGLNPMGYHLTNVILHGLNTFLVVILVIRLMEIAQQRGLSLFTDGILSLRAKRSNLTTGLPCRSAPRNDNSHQWGTSVITAAVTGLLFGLHPLHVESVAWASERKDVLYAFFFLLSIISYMSYATYKKYTSYLLSLVFFLLALLSKPMAVSLPVVLLIMDWYPFRRFEVGADLRVCPNNMGHINKGEHTDSPLLKPIFMEKLPFFVLSLASIGITMAADRSGFGIAPLIHVPLSTKMLVALKAMVYYLGKMLWPSNLIPFHPYPKEVFPLSLEYLLPVLLAVGITFACIAALKKQRILPAVCAYYIVTLLPVTGLTQQAMADRFTYLPSVGPFLMVGLGATWFFERLSSLKRWNPILKIVALTMTAVVVISMSSATIRQTSVWKDGIILWSYVIEKEPRKTPLAYNNRGSVYEKIGQYDKAIEDFSSAITLNPGYAEAYRNRGVTYEKTGRYDKAIEDFSLAITLNPGYAEAYHNRGAAYGKIDQYDKAIEDLSTAITLNPNYAKAYNDRGVAYDRTGQYDRAVEDFSSAIALDPGDVGAYSNRGIVYFRLAFYDEALKDFTRAIGLNPNSSELYSYRGNIYKILGRSEEAERDFMEAERIKK